MTPLSAVDARPAAPLRFQSAGRAFVGIARPLTSSVTPRHRRVGSILPTVSCRPAHISVARRVGFTCRVRVVPPSPLSRSGLIIGESTSPNSERMEERLRTPSVMSALLSACADPRCVSASGTKHPAMLDKTESHASSVTISCVTRVPFRSSAAVKRRLCGAYEECSRALRLSARCGSFLSHRPPRQADRTVCAGLGCPSVVCLATRHEARTPIRTDRHLLPTASTTSTRASSAPGVSSRLAPRP